MRTERQKPEGLTPSQTVGPFFAYVLTPREYGYPEIVTNDLALPDATGERIRIEGYVMDGDGEPIVDAMLEVWQPNGEGRFTGTGTDSPRNTAFSGFGRAQTDSNGFYSFTTVLPGTVDGPNGVVQAPHVNVGIFARGLLNRLFTRVYFDGQVANAQDPILAVVPTDRRATLIAPRGDRGGHAVYTFNIRLQGEAETVFFEA